MGQEGVSPSPLWSCSLGLLFYYPTSLWDLTSFIFEADILTETWKMEIKNIISWSLSCLNVGG